MKKTIWIATSNAHKIEEFAEMLGDEVTIKSFKDLKEPVDVVENGTSFQENARIKARALYNIVHEPVLRMILVWKLMRWIKLQEFIRLGF